jgi:hypothetical protein
MNNLISTQKNLYQCDKEHKLSSRISRPNRNPNKTKANRIEFEKDPNLSRSRVLALATGAFVEVLRGILGGDHPDLEHQVLSAGPYPGDGPPLEEGPNTNWWVVLGLSHPKS